MKKVLRLFGLFVVLAVFALMAMGSGSSEDEQENEGTAGGTSVSVAEKTDSEPSWEVGEASVTTWKNSIGTSWVQVIVPVTNTGSCNLYLNSSNIDLEDSEGHLADTISSVSGYPQILKPGETGVYCEETTLDDGTPDNLSALPHLDIVKAKTECIRYEVSDLSITDEEYLGVKVMGRVENDTDEEISMVYVVAVLYDAENRPLGTTLEITGSILPNDKIGFSSTAITLPDDITSSDVDHYEVFAYPYQFQF